MLSSTSTMTGIGSEPMTGLAYVASVAGHYAACFALLNSARFHLDDAGGSLVEGEGLCRRSRQLGPERPLRGNRLEETN
jgi:hypothetical protein